MPTDLSFFRYEICILVIWRNFGDSIIANIFKVMPEWIWPFSSSIELLVELLLSQTLYNWKNIEKRQLWIRPMGVILIYKYVEKRQLWVRPVWMVETQFCKLRGTSDTFVKYVFLWTKHTIWLLILSFTQNIVRACSMFYHEGYRSVTPLDAARVNRTVFHNHFVHWYYITLIKGRDYSKHDMNCLLYTSPSPRD